MNALANFDVKELDEQIVITNEKIKKAKKNKDITNLNDLIRLLKVLINVRKFISNQFNTTIASSVSINEINKQIVLTETKLKKSKADKDNELAKDLYCLLKTLKYMKKIINEYENTSLDLSSSAIFKEEIFDRINETRYAKITINEDTKTIDIEMIDENKLSSRLHNNLKNIKDRILNLKRKNVR